MKTLYLSGILMLVSLSVFSQNLQFTSPCDTTFTYCINGNSCDSSLTSISATATSDDDCNQGNNALSFNYTLRISTNGTVDEVNGQGNQLTQSLPRGNHQVVFRALDNCTGEMDSCTIQLSVVDCEAPVVSCLPGITTVPMILLPGEEIEIWASDFDLGSYDNCTNEDNLTFAFSIDPNDKTIFRDCDDISGIPEYLTVYAFDEAGNWNTCDIGILLMTCSLVSQTACFEAKTICGEEIPKFSIITNCDQDTTEVNYSIGCPGIQDAPCNVMSFYKDDRWLNGVSTLDLYLIQKHILEIDFLDSPYKIIAADVDNSKEIDVFDIIELRKLILYRQTSIADNTSWRFVPDDYTFANSSDPLNEQFPETVVVDPFPSEEITGLVAMKTGDVNCTADPNMVRGSGQVSQDRGQYRTLNLIYENKNLKAGETIQLSLTAEAFNAIVGFQFSLAYDETYLELVDLKGTDALPSLNTKNFVTMDGHIRCSWNVAAGQDLKEEAALVDLTFKAKADGRLSDLLWMEDADLVAEAYVENYEEIEITNLQLLAREKTTTAVEGAIKLYQNTPNPFTTQTTIRFHLPETTRASVTVYDLNGRVIANVADGQFAKGDHQLTLQADQFQAAGIYFYELKTPTEKMSQKLVLMY